MSDKKKKETGNSKKDGFNKAESPGKKSKSKGKGAINVKYLDPNLKDSNKIR